MRERWTVHSYRDFVWDSGLCQSHKLLLLGLMHYMGADRGLCFPSRKELGRKVSMGASTITRNMKDLEDHGWIRVGGRPDIRLGPGAKPNVFKIPVIAVPTVPEHCLRVRTGFSNLRRGPVAADEVEGQPGKSPPPEVVYGVPVPVPGADSGVVEVSMQVVDVRTGEVLGVVPTELGEAMQTFGQIRP